MRTSMLAAFALTLAVPAPVSAADGLECVGVKSESAAQGVSLGGRNTCDFAVRCQLSWRVVCDGDAPDAAPRPMSLVVRLESAVKQTLFASGAACGAQIWEIVDGVWDCREMS